MVLIKVLGERTDVASYLSYYAKIGLKDLLKIEEDEILFEVVVSDYFVDGDLKGYEGIVIDVTLEKEYENYRSEIAKILNSFCAYFETRTWIKFNILEASNSFVFETKEVKKFKNHDHCGCGDDCECGCQEGKECTCEHDKCECGCQEHQCHCNEEKCDCGCGPDCKCGCQEGKECTCEHDKCECGCEEHQCHCNEEKCNCGCGDDCKCGCQEGKECTCEHDKCECGCHDHCECNH